MVPTGKIDSILIAYPPITAFERYGSALGSAGGKQLPLGPFYLASYLRANGITVDVVDAEGMELSNGDIVKRLADGGHRILGVSSTTVAFHRALELARAVKQAVPETVIVIGGPHVSSQPAHAMQFPEFDYAIQNEGEETLLEFMQALAAGKDLSKVKGLIYREDGKVVVNERRPYIENLDDIPLPAYDLIPDFGIYTPPPSNYRKSPVANVITSRGCPYECTFCMNDTFGRQLRLRSAENVAAEIELLMTKYGIREIAFVDDTFTCKPQHVREIFKLTAARGLHFPWTCMARVNTVDEEFLRFMKDSGCWHISFGIESGDPGILKEIKKKIDLAQAERAVAACRKVGILTKGFFIVGHPLETVESIDKTIALALQLNLDDVVVTLNTPMPGSCQHDNVERYGRLQSEDWRDFSCWKPVFIPHGLTEEILVSKQKEFYRRFYVRPRIIWRYFLSFLSLTGFRRLFTLLSASRFLFKK